VTVGLKEANQQFGKVVRAVRKGQTVVLTDRGKPFAEIKPLADPYEAKLAELEADGILRRPAKPGKMDLTGWKPIKIKGKSILETLDEIREDRL